MKTFIIITIIASGIFLTSCAKRYGCYYSLNVEAPEISQPATGTSEKMKVTTCSLEE